MRRIIRDLTNRIFHRAVAKIDRRQLYKKTVADFYAAKMTRNASLAEAAEAFENQVQNHIDQKAVVFDLRVLAQNGSHITVQTLDNQVFETLNLATNSYNDLDLEKECRLSLSHYVATQPLSSCLSRKVAGQLPVHLELENEICDYLGYDTCVLATSGYIAQQAALFGLFSENDVIFSDQHNHASLVDGMRLSKAKIIVYSHLDYDELESLMKKYRHQYNCAGIVSDGVFSAHGTVANLDRIHELKERFNAVSVIDDTHGFTVVGNKGRGAIDLFKHKPDVLTASMAKGLAGFGGLIVADKALARVIDSLGRQNINTSHLSPLIAAQCLVNLKYYRRNLEAMTTGLQQKLVCFNEALKKVGLQQYENSNLYAHPIFSFSGKIESEMVHVFKELMKFGVTAAFFPPPVAPEPTIRFSLHRMVSDEDLKSLATFLGQFQLTPVSKTYWPQMQKMQILSGFREESQDEPHVREASFQPIVLPAKKTLAPLRTKAEA